MAPTAHQQRAEARSARHGQRQRVVTPPTWDREDYPRIDGGLRMVRAHKIQGPEWVIAYGRWSLRIEFHTMDEPGTVSLFLNLGTVRKNPKVPGRKSNFYRYWTLANGGPPKRGQTMHWDVFLDKCFWARVEDCKEDSQGHEKEEYDVYSRIVDLEKLITQ